MNWRVNNMSKSKSKIEWLAVIIMMAILIPMFWNMFAGYQECTYQGGVYARSLFWFTCIK